MTEIDKETVESIAKEINDVVSKMAFSFDNPEDAREYSPATTVVVLMRNNETGEEEYRPIRMESVTGRVLYTFSNPGYTPITETITDIELTVEGLVMSNPASLIWQQYRRQYLLMNRNTQCAVIGAQYNGIDVTSYIEWIEQSKSDEFVVRCNPPTDDRREDKELHIVYIGFDPDTEEGFFNVAIFTPGKYDVTQDGRFIYGVCPHVYTWNVSYDFIHALYEMRNKEEESNAE